MLGAQGGAAVPAFVAPAAADVTPAVTGGASAASRQAAGILASPWIYLLLAAAYFAWAYFENHHQRIRDAVKPANVALNARTIAAVMATVIVGGLGLKILLGKLAAVKAPFIGTPASWLLKVVDAAL